MSTTINTSIEVPASRLLANDVAAIGALQIVSLGKAVGGKVSSGNNRAVVFTPDPGLVGTASFVYTVQDGSGAQSSATVVVQVAVVPTSIWSGSQPTSMIVENDPHPVELGVKFYSDVPGYVLGVRFYKSPQDTGAHAVSLWNGNGARLATAVSANESASGWQDVRFVKPVQIRAGTTYVASFHSSGHYGTTHGYFSRRVSNAVLHAPANGERGTNGVYRYGTASAFPNQSWNASNYWVDVVFDSTVTADTTPPTAPSALTATATSASQIALSWSASQDPQGGAVRYEIRRGGTLLTTTSATTYADTGLSASTTYTYGVRAFDQAGNGSTEARASATTPAAVASTGCKVALGPNASLGGMLPFPSDSPWNRDVSNDPVDPLSDRVLSQARLGNARLHPDFGSGTYAGTKIGNPYIVVPIDQPMVRMVFTDYAAESDPGPYPFPPNALIQGLGATGYNDRHVIVVQRDCSKPNGLGKLYETFNTVPVGNYPTRVDYWRAVAGAVFDMNSNALRPAGWTSATAAGTPMFPGLVRYDEVAAGEIRHALNFTLAPGYTRKAWVHPATHHAGSGVGDNLVPFGARVRLKANVDISWLPPQVQVIARAMKKYGMIMNDNGGNWYISGVPDERWRNDVLRYLGELRANDFELVKMGPVVTR